MSCVCIRERNLTEKCEVDECKILLRPGCDSRDPGGVINVYEKEKR